MTVYIDNINKLIIMGSSTKASKYLKKNYEALGLFLIFDNFSPTFGKVALDLSLFDLTEEVTATKYVSNFGIDIKA